ncbi:MAG: tetratricopeptide repeat protein [Verrucomicrobia bacterium]|nr:tetratricopeptide repeat protein [Verrucomicrobiota bacterium]
MKHSQDIYGTQRRSRDDDDALGSSAAQHEEMIAREVHKGRKMLLIYSFTFAAFFTAVAIIIVQQYLRTLEPGNGDAQAAAEEAYVPVTPLDLNADPVSFFLTDELAQLAAADDIATEGELSVGGVKRAAFHIVQGETAAREGRFDDAVEQYQMVLTIYPQLIGAHRNLGLIHLRQKNYVAALKAFAEAEKEGDTEVGVVNNLGVAALHLDEVNQAEDAFLRALDIQPDYSAARFNLGVLYLKDKKWDKAVIRLSQYLEAAPEDMKAAHSLAYALIQLERWPDAAEILEQISQVQTDSPPVLFRLAQARFHTGQDKEALVALQKGASMLDPRIASSWLNGEDFDIARENTAFQDLQTQLINAAR